MHTAATLAPFITWLATREPDEGVRRRHRRVVEDYLTWSLTDPGLPDDRRRRYEAEAARRGTAIGPIVAALDRFAEHGAIRDAARVPEG